VAFLEAENEAQLRPGIECCDIFREISQFLASFDRGERSAAFNGLFVCTLRPEPRDPVGKDKAATGF
jgi:hypothetical protein